MKRATYDKIDLVAKRCTTLIALPVCYLAIFLAKSFLVVVLITVIAFLPYILGYNLFVRGFLFRRIED